MNDFEKKLSSLIDYLNIQIDKESEIIVDLTIDSIDEPFPEELFRSYGRHAAFKLIREYIYYHFF